MADLVALFSGSLERFLDRVARVDEGQWSAATPCAEWRVRDVVNHVTYEQLWAPHLVAGETVEQVGDRYDGDVLGADPLTAARAAADGSLAAFGAADLDASVHLSYADVPCREYLTQMLTDAEVHGWDLATATGQDPTLDPAVVAVLLPVALEQEDLLRGSGMFGELQPVPHDADEATRLLAVLGRRSAP
jgi:uncharacterized protein (TIGR03086 family)